MQYKIDNVNGKYYVFAVDQYGNLQDSMHHFNTYEKAQIFVRRLIKQDIALGDIND